MTGVGAAKGLTAGVELAGGAVAGVSMGMGVGVGAGVGAAECSCSRYLALFSAVKWVFDLTCIAAHEETVGGALLSSAAPKLYAVNPSTEQST